MLLFAEQLAAFLLGNLFVTCVLIPSRLSYCFLTGTRLSANGQEPSAQRLAWFTLFVRPDCATAALAQASAPFRQPNFVTPGNYRAWS